MKNIYLTFALLFSYSALTFAQDGYTYTFEHSGGLTFTVQAVPNTSSNNFATSVQSYGFTVILPDGVTIDTGGATSLGGAASATFFDGSAIGQPSIDGYLITETLGSPATLSAPSAAMNSDMYTFTVNGNPASGTMYILENNSALATTITPLKSFMQADMIDNGSAQFVNVVDPNGPAVSGMSSFDFNTLSIEEIDMEPISILLYPNPTKDFVTIESNATITQIELYDVLGKQVFISPEDFNNQIDMSDLPAGLYLAVIKLENTQIEKRLVKI